MKVRSLGVAVAISMIGWGAAVAQVGGDQDVRTTRAVVGTTPTQMWAIASIDPDCTPNGHMVLTILHQPEHGTLTVVTEPMYIAYPTNNPRSVCNSRKIVGSKAVYTASQNYSGHDYLELQAASSSAGSVRRVMIDVNVH